MSKPQLFCFTYAGGNAAFFDGLRKQLPEIEVNGLEYAGHGVRFKEPFYNSFDELADDLFAVFRERYANSAYSLFGYSMGTIALVEVLRRIIAAPGIVEPSNVFLAAHTPYTRVEWDGLSDNNVDEWVKERTIRFGAVPERLLTNNSFWRTYLPLYRADYSIIGKYRFERLKLRSAIPATVFYSESDTPRNKMEGWKQYFMGECEFFQYEGAHFFIRDHLKKIAGIINERMNGSTKK